MAMLKIYMYLFLSIFLPATFCLAEELPEEVRVQLRQKAEEAIQNTPPAHVYGKVLDMKGNPVEGVKVLIGWSLLRNVMFTSKPPRETWLETNENGLWEFHGEKLFSVHFGEVQKEGFVYTDTIYPAVSVHRGLIYDTSPDNPVVITMRKKGEGTFLLKERRRRLVWIEAGQEAQTIWFDVIQHKDSITPPDDLPEKKKIYADLEIVVSPPEEVLGKWNLTYKATGSGSGIITSNEELFIAPESGYQPEVVVSGPPFFKYLYLKTREPALYARLEIEHSLNKELFRLYVKSWVNPYGSRNLEYNDDLDQVWRLRKQLKKEAREIISKGQPFNKGNLLKRISIAKEKRKQKQK